MKKYYVTMNDKSLSGWGGAVGRISKFIIECDTLAQAEEVEAVARRDHWNMKYVHIHENLPPLPCIQISCKRGKLLPLHRIPL